MSNKNEREHLVRKFGEQCFLNGEISEKNILTYHHINRQEGSLLCRLEHDYFHVIEREKRHCAKELNNGFRDFKIKRDLELLKEMRAFVLTLIDEMGYEVFDTGKLLVLRRF